AAGHPTSVPPAPTTTWNTQPLSFKPTGHTVGLAPGAVTVEQMPVTARITEPLLLQDEHSTATSSPSISRSSAEPRSTAMLLSQEVILGLDETISPLATAASISQEEASPMKMAAATASPPNIEEASMAAPLSADSLSASLAKVTFSSTTIGTGKATEPGTRTLPNTDHSASQGAPGPPTQLPPDVLPQLPDDAVLGTGETLPLSHSTAPGTAGHGLPGDKAVTQPHATTQAVGTLATVMDVIAGEHIPPLGSTSVELVSSRNEASTKATPGTAILETEDTPGGLSMSLSSHAALSDPDGPSPRPFPHSMGFLLPQSLSTGFGTITAEAAAGGSPPATPSMAMPLSLTGTSGAKIDKALPAAAAAPPPSITVFGIRTVPTAHPSSFVSNTPISEAGMGSASLASSSATTILGDTEATLPVLDEHPSHSQPDPTAGSTTPGTGVTPRSALTPVLWAGPQTVEAPGTEMPSPNTAPGTARAVSDSPGGPRAVTVPMASQADVPPLLEGRANVGMALEGSPSSIPQEMTAVMSPLSLTAPLQAMGASGDPQSDGSTTGRAMGMGFLEVSTEENPSASAAGPSPSHAIVTARPSPKPPVTEGKPTAGITSLTVGNTNVREATAASWTGATGTTAHVETTHSESSTEGAAASASTNSTHVPDSNTTGTSLATMPASTPSTSTFPSNANLPTTSTGWETFVTRVTTAMPPATAGATSTSSAPSLAVTHSETSGGGQPVPSPAARSPLVETTLGSWGILGPSTAVAVSGSPLPSLHSPTEEATTAPLSLLGVGATTVAAAGQTPTESATGTTSTSISYHDMGQAASTPVTTLSHAFGTQRGPSTKLSTSAYTTTGHRAPAPEPQPTHELIKPATSLYPFGVEGGDQEYVQRMVDFNSPLFKPEIGFPFGKSLRDALYAKSYPSQQITSSFGQFTDNGQIIFPPTDNYVPSNPNPPPWGFTGQESLPMVAAFWDDADFSKGVGTTWYQEYSTLSSTQDPVVQDVEAKIKKYLKIPYVAKWTLKVTWEKAPAYPSQRDDTQTSTYQAVLTTDGNRSFALLLYQDGGMRWDYTRLAAANVLIGFSSGNGYAQNNKLTQKPPAVKYRPDQYSSAGSGMAPGGPWGGWRWQELCALCQEHVPSTHPWEVMGQQSHWARAGHQEQTVNETLAEQCCSLVAPPDVRGLWIYRLDSRSRVNYRLQCLAWLNTEPAPATWNSQLPPCPCSQPQAEMDPRYHWSRGAKDTPQDQLQEDTSVRMLRTVSPSPAGAGVRCLYQGGSFLEGWQERAWSLPFHTATGKWELAFPRPKIPQASSTGRVRTPTHPITSSTDRELEGFDLCCRRVGKPLFCARFAEKRPRVGCEGYVPPTPAGAFGDPHITTLDGLTYTFNGLGDFVLLLASDAQTSFVLQGRTARTGMAQATNFVAFAAQYISNTTTTVEWTLGSQDDIQVLLNNETIQFSYSQDLRDEVYYSPGVLLVNASSVTAVFDGTIAVSVSATSGILSVLCSLPDWYRNSTRGLLGVWDHDPADDFQMPNGTSIPVNSSEEEIYSYGMTWAVGEHSLFAQPLDSPALNFTPFFLSRLRQENESQYQLAASQCHGSKECIYDSLSTGNLALGLATQSLAVDFQQRKTTLNAFPPIITGDASITAFKTEKVRRQYHALGAGAHFIPHLSPELNISENGTLIWKPRGIAPFTINLEAVGSNNVSALVQLHFTLCRCSRSQECDYSNTVILGESSLQKAPLVTHCACPHTSCAGCLLCPPILLTFPKPVPLSLSQLAACRCESGYSGAFCQNPPDPCSQGCFPGVGCDPFSGCGPCPPGLTGDGQHCSGCGSACGYRSCPEGYCSNGGHCHIHPITCAPTCTCPQAFTDQRCQVAGGDFQPLPSTGLPRRSIQMRIKTLQNTTAEEVNSTVSAILDSLEVKAFQSNTNITQMTDSDGFTFVVVSEFAYDSRSTVIHFLNEELPAAITGAFNRQRGRREVGTGLLFQRLHRDNITDLVKLTVGELRDYFPCSLNGYKGYQLRYIGTIGFVCISPCKMDYCQHGGQCQHLPEGPTCTCLPFSIYSPAGAQCEWLAISLAAFLGILLGALALLCLLFAIACLALHLCRQHRRQRQG
ncbi:Mucin-4, partial [Lamprotornis superbus]